MVRHASAPLRRVGLGRHHDWLPLRTRDGDVPREQTPRLMVSARDWEVHGEVMPTDVKRPARHAGQLWRRCESALRYACRLATQSVAPTSARPRALRRTSGQAREIRANTEQPALHHKAVREFRQLGPTHDAMPVGFSGRLRPGRAPVGRQGEGRDGLTGGGIPHLRTAARPAYQIKKIKSFCHDEAQLQLRRQHRQ